MSAHTVTHDEEPLRPKVGRSLCFSPAWQDEDCSVVFDRNSGDFWVVTNQARHLLQLAASSVPARTKIEGDSHIGSLIADLCAADLIEPLQQAAATQTPPA